MTACPTCGAATQDGAGEPIVVDDTAIETAFCDAQVVQAQGHARQDIPPATRRLVIRRQHGKCAVPGCRLPIDDVHHIQLRSEGGSNHECNLIGLDSAHHAAVHRGALWVNGTWSTGVTLHARRRVLVRRDGGSQRRVDPLRRPPGADVDGLQGPGDARSGRGRPDPRGRAGLARGGAARGARSSARGADGVADRHGRGARHRGLAGHPFVARPRSRTLAQAAGVGKGAPGPRPQASTPSSMQKEPVGSPGPQAARWRTGRGAKGSPAMASRSPPRTWAATPQSGDTRLRSTCGDHPRAGGRVGEAWRSRPGAAAATGAHRREELAKILPMSPG
jgi:hypothetical protein